MNNKDNKEFLLKAEQAFKALFKKAKETDELHFAFSLSPEFRPYKINTALDAQNAFKDYYDFLHNNDKSPIHVRIALAFYCHIAEASGFWEIPKNLLCIIEGNKYNLIPFGDLVKKYGDKEGSILPSANKVMRSLMKYSQKMGFHDLAEVFKDAFDPDIRNGYAHADYALLNEGVCVGSRYGKERIINWDEFNLLLHKAVNFYMVFIGVLQENLSYYDPPKVIKGVLSDREGEPEGTWEISYKADGTFVIKGGAGYVPGQG